MLKQVCMLSVLISIVFCTNAMGQEKSPSEGGLSGILYRRPYLLMGAGVALYLSKREVLVRNPIGWWLLGTSVLGVATKVVAHESLVSNGVHHRHRGMLIDYSEFLKKKECVCPKIEMAWWSYGDWDRGDLL